MTDEAGSTASEQPAADDIRSTLAAAIAEHESVAAPPAAETATATEGGAKEASAEGDAKIGERQRDENGKFVKQDAPKEPVLDKSKQAPAKGKQEVAAAAPDPKAAAAATPDAKEPPANWSEADKKTFKSLPATAQTFLLDRHKAMEADYTKKTQAVADLKREYEPVDQLFTPHRDVMKQKGFTPSSLITAWFNVEKALMEGKGVEIIQRLIPAYKIDAAALAKALGFGNQAPAKTDAPPTADGKTPDPTTITDASGRKLNIADFPELKAELDKINARFHADDEAKANAARAAHDQAGARVMSSIEEFKGAKDEKGELQYPYFEEVEAQMTALTATTPRASGQSVPDYLKQLYETAVWANPSTRAKLQESQRAAETAQRAAEEQKRKTEDRAKAEKARRAASSVTGSPSGQTPRERGRSDRSLREELLAAAEDDEAA